MIKLQYIPRNMHTVFALLCLVVAIHWLIFPYPSGLLHWHCGNLTIAPVPAKQPWWIWINTSCEFIMNDCITTTKQSTTKPCAYFLGYTVSLLLLLAVIHNLKLGIPWIITIYEFRRKLLSYPKSIAGWSWQITQCKSRPVLWQNYQHIKPAHIWSSVVFIWPFHIISMGISPVFAELCQIPDRILAPWALLSPLEPQVTKLMCI